jgi:hypothetical protein
MTDSSVPRPQPACTPADDTTLSPDERYKDTIALLADVVLQGGIAFQALAARAAPYLEALSALATRIAPYMQALAALAARPGWPTRHRRWKCEPCPGQVGLPGPT